MFYLARSYAEESKYLHIPGLDRIGLNKRDVITSLVFITAILSSNYAMSGVPNIKLFDLLVFSAGYVLGFRRGVVVAASAWLLYGTFNPWGSADSLLLTVLMASETVYAFLGFCFRGLVSRRDLRLFNIRQTKILISFAILATFSYDLFTNTYTGIVWANMSGGSYWFWIKIALFNPGALLFSLVHVAGNVIMFSIMGPLIIKGFTFLHQKN